MKATQWLVPLTSGTFLHRPLHEKLPSNYDTLILPKREWLLQTWKHIIGNNKRKHCQCQAVIKLLIHAVTHRIIYMYIHTYYSCFPILLVTWYTYVSWVGTLLGTFLQGPLIISMIHVLCPWCYDRLFFEDLHTNHLIIRSPDPPHNLKSSLLW